MSVASLIADLVRAGTDPELVGRVAEALAAREPVVMRDDQAERRRAADRERKRLRISAESAEIKAPPVSPLFLPPTPPNQNPPIPPQNHKQGEREAEEFSIWYEGYPHKVGKAAALKAFAKARKKTELPALISALRRYVESKPPDREWCNPATWLNEERWADEPNEPKEKRNGQRSVEDQFKRAFERVDSYIDALE